MAAAVEANWSGPLTGLVVTRYGHSVPCRHIEVIEAAHPVPDAAGYTAARRIVDLVGGLTADDLVLCLLSGGGSALLVLPAPGIALEDKQAINRALLRCGAPIGEMNCVRKHLSAIKGGRLAVAAAPTPVVSLMISDVPGDDPSVIASGPTVPDETTAAQAVAILEKYRIEIPASVLEHLLGPSAETPKPGDPRFRHVSNRVIATPQDALEAAAQVARTAGFRTLILGNAIEGEARGRPGITAIAADTDGIDGSEDNAGAILSPDTLDRAGRAGLEPKAHLANNDAYPIFARLGDLVVTGPTRTNVNDFRAILIDKRS